MANTSPSDPKNRPRSSVGSLFRWKLKSNKKRVYIRRGLLITLAIAAVLLAWQISSDATTKQTLEESSGGRSADPKGPVVESPTFATLLPEGKMPSDYGGWRRISPPNNEAVYAYSDRIGKVGIIVSQQQLPKDIKENPDKQLKALATGFTANDTFEVNGTLIYSGVSAKGPQSLIFIKDNLLILIKADSEIEQADWQNYISSLR